MSEIDTLRRIEDDIKGVVERVGWLRGYEKFKERCNTTEEKIVGIKAMVDAGKNGIPECIGMALCLIHLKNEFK